MLGLFFLGIVWVTFGVIYYAYYIPEIATQFFVIGVVCGLAACISRLPGMSLNRMARAFQEGAGGMIGAALIVGLAKGLVLLLGGSDLYSASVLNTILYFFATLLDGLHGAFSLWCMYGF